MTSTNCIACGKNDYADYGGGLVRCTTCNLVVAADIPSDADLTKLYQQDYFFGQEYFDYEADRPALEANFRRRIRRLDGLFQPSSRVIEVGCAYGYFLGLIKDRVAWHQGYDVSSDGIKFAVEELGVNAKEADFLADDIAPESIDTVVMWDVVEHLPRPHDFIEHAAKALKPGGALVLTTGDISALVPRLRGPKWRMIHPPTHIYYFDPRNISRVLRRYGLEVQEVNYPAVWRNLGSVANQLLINQRGSGKPARLMGAAEKLVRRSGLAKLNLPINTYDIMEVVAVKAPAAAA